MLSRHVVERALRQIDPERQRTAASALYQLGHGTRFLQALLAESQREYLEASLSDVPDPEVVKEKRIQCRNLQDLLELCQNYGLAPNQHYQIRQ